MNIGIGQRYVNLTNVSQKVALEKYDTDKFLGRRTIQNDEKHYYLFT